MKNKKVIVSVINFYNQKNMKVGFLQSFVLGTLALIASGDNTSATPGKPTPQPAVATKHASASTPPSASVSRQATRHAIDSFGFTPRVLENIRQFDNNPVLPKLPEGKHIFHFNPISGELEIDNNATSIIKSISQEAKVNFLRDYYKFIHEDIDIDDFLSTNTTPIDELVFQAAKDLGEKCSGAFHPTRIVMCPFYSSLPATIKLSDNVETALHKTITNFGFPGILSLSGKDRLTSFRLVNVESGHERTPYFLLEITSPSSSPEKTPSKHLFAFKAHNGLIVRAPSGYLYTFACPTESPIKKPPQFKPGHRGDDGPAPTNDNGSGFFLDNGSAVVRNPHDNGEHYFIAP